MSDPAGDDDIMVQAHVAELLAKPLDERVAFALECLARWFPAERPLLVLIDHRTSVYSFVPVAEYVPLLENLCATWRRDAAATREIQVLQ